MKDYRIQFDQLPWTSAAPGAEQKTVVHGNQRLRLVRFNDAFIEPDWCTAGHIGLVLSGTMRVNFSGRMVHYQQGDGLWIAEGEVAKHKVEMEPGTVVELVLFETVAAG